MIKNYFLVQKNNAGKTIWKNTLLEIEKAYTSIYPEAEFKYSFIDDTIAHFYDQQQQTGRLLSWATALLIFISSPGLLGLVILPSTAA